MSLHQFLTCFLNASLVSACLLVASLALGQATDESVEEPAATTDEEPTAAPAETVDIDPQAEDSDIATRLVDILKATDWFESPNVRVEEGVVFLSGMVDEERHRLWAGELARRTQDVVAVVNKIHVRPRGLLDFTPAIERLQAMARSTVQSLPILLVVIALLILTWWIAKLAIRIARHLMNRRLDNRLLGSVLAPAAAIPVVLIGFYLTLQVAGLTRLATTLLGGTGLLGIVIGIAFRDIAENFLASILISVQRPFRSGDLVEVADQKGFVKSVTTRGTLLMTLDGNHVQVPNATIYKSIIQNFTSNPNVRLSFVVGIDYNDSASEGQQVVFETLSAHEAVLSKPEPLVLIESLAASTVNLEAFFWVNGHDRDPLKVRSSILRRVKQRLQQAGLTLPDEAREVIFPHGVPVELTGDTSDDAQPPALPAPEKPTAKESDTSSAEGDLTQDQAETTRQAAEPSRRDEGVNLLGE